MLSLNIFSKRVCLATVPSVGRLAVSPHNRCYVQLSFGQKIYKVAKIESLYGDR